MLTLCPPGFSGSRTQILHAPACNYVSKVGVPLAPPQKKVTFVITKTNKDDVFASFSVGVMDSGVDDEGDGTTDDDGDNGDGATDSNVDKDGDGDSARDDDGDSDCATDDDDNNDNDGDDSNGAVADDDDVDDDNDSINDFDKDTCRRALARGNGCDETKTEEEETVADSVAIHTTIKQITGRGGGRWRRRRRRRRRRRQWQRPRRQ